MCATKALNWQSILAQAAHCDDCSDPACTQVCPHRIDIRSVLKYLLGMKPGIWWVEDMHAAIEYADEAIEACFA